MTQISGEIERLNSVLRSKVEEITNLDARCRQIQAENEQITKRLREATETARRVPEYEGKMALLGQ
jgi:prefoldin subunit 5